MCNMIKYGRGDLYLGELIMIGNKNIVFNCNGLILEPIEGIKAAFIEPRHFVVSKISPNSKEIYQALDNGLNILRETGEIEQAFYPITHNKTIIDSWVDLLSLPPKKSNTRSAYFQMTLVQIPLTNQQT